MLSRGDARLVERDIGLPGLAFVLDADAVARWVRTQAPRARVRRARPFYARYKPGTSCLAAYVVECAGGPVIVTAKAYRFPSVEKIAKAQRIVSAASVLGAGAFVRPDLSVVVTVFPCDLRLPSLRRFTGALRAKVLERLLPDSGPDPTITVLSYKPERRLVARVDGPRGRAVVRIYSDAEFAAVAGARIASLAGPVRLARTLARHPRYPIVATEWLNGITGTALLASPARIGAIGAALAKLHTTDTAALVRTRSAQDDARQLRQAARGLGDLLPECAARIGFLSRTLAEALAAADETPLVTHGDFALQQAVYTDEGVALIDLDQMALGHPAADIGSFVADLEYRGLTNTVAAHHVADAVARFLEGYVSVRPLPPAIEIHTAAQLLRRAPLPFRTRLPDWPLRITQIVDRCEARPWRGETQRASSGRNRHMARAGGHTVAAAAVDAAMPWLEAALDPSRVTQVFAAAPWGAGITVETARILRHKPGRRCLVRYTLRGGAHDVVLAKTRTKGLDRRTARVNESLFTNGFGASSTDGIEVPPFVGVVPQLRMWVQAAVPGQSAEVHLGAGNRAVALRLSDVVAKLQRFGPQPDRTHTIADELTTLEQRLCAFVDRRPRWGARLARLLEGCSRLADSVEFSPLVPAHRDFYPEQVMVDGDRLVLLDLDLYALAHPALDAGNCLAHAIELGLRPGADGEAAQEVVGVLHDAFEAPLPPDARPAVDVFTTLTLARLIDIDDRIEHRRPCVEPLIEICEARLSRARALPQAHHRVSAHPA